MSITAADFNLKKLKKCLDWKLLLFLILFLDVKLGVKIAAIILIYLLQADFRFKFKFKNSRLPLFYPLAIVLALADLIINKNYTSPNYPLVLLTGIGFWLLCILAIHQVKLSVEHNDVIVLHRTILIFFIINTVISLLNLGYLIWETGALNPYAYQGDHQKFFINTGDYIKGLTFDTSTANAVLNAFGVIYFLTRKNAVMLLVCMTILLFTGSNFTNLVLACILLLLFFFKSTRNQKSLILVCLVFLVVFMSQISPQNSQYVQETFNNILRRPNPVNNHPQVNPVPLTLMPDRLLNAEQRKEKIAQRYIDSIYDVVNYKFVRQANPVVKSTPAVAKTPEGRIYVPGSNINKPPYQSLKTTPAQQAPLIAFVNAHKSELPLSGKPFIGEPIPGNITSMRQTLNFFKQHPAKIATGDGMGNFSSKLAFKATGLDIAGGYPSKYTYINRDFSGNHLDLYLNFFSNPAQYHSLVNSPFSAYDQVFAEYGALGFLSFCIYYIGFFTKNLRLLTYGVPILLLTIAVLFIDYWFEQLSILIFFELLLLLDIKESSANLNLNYGH